MTAPGRTAPTPPPTDGEDPRARAIGIALIAAAVIIGVVLLAKGFSQEGSLVSTDAAETDTSTSTTAPTGGAVEESPTTVAPAARPPAQVSVLVANGSGATGVAGTNADKLETAGYTNVETTNAPSTAKTTVYYTAGAQADAEAVARALGLDAAVVAAMPSTPPVDLAGATVLVIVGTDRS